MAQIGNRPGIPNSAEPLVMPSGQVTRAWQQFFVLLNLGIITTGQIIYYGGNDVPKGYLQCDSSAVSREGQANLFAVIGTNFGPGDGVNTFNLPPPDNPFGAGLGAIIKT